MQSAVGNCNLWTINKEFCGEGCNYLVITCEGGSN